MITEEPHLKLASKTENLNQVETLINQICENYKISEDHFGNILVALTEAVTNAMQHGNQSDPEKNIEIFCRANELEVSFTIKDEGSGFNYDNLPDPTALENLEKPSGRGVFLMKNLADKVDFEDNGATVILKFNLK